MSTLIIEPIQKSIDDIAIEESISDLILEDINLKTEIEIINLNQKFQCKIDTGASCCSFGVTDIHDNNGYVTFNLNDKTYKMNCDYQVIQTSEGEEKRPVVLFNCKINDEVHDKIQFNLNDRTHMPDQVLIGLNLIEKLSGKINPSI